MIIRPPYESSLFAAGGPCVANAANFPFLGNSYYWDGSVNADVTAMLDAMGGSSYDPSGTLTQDVNGVNIGNTSQVSTTLNLSKITGTSNILVWVSGKPDFLTSNAGIYINGSGAVTGDAVSIQQNATQTIFTVADVNVSGFTHAATVANVELQDQVCAIMVKNPTGSSLTADYYIVAENGASVATGALTPGGAIAGINWGGATTPISVSKYTAGSGLLHAFGVFKFATVPSANDLKGLLGWMHVQFKTKQARGMYPYFRGRT